MKPVAKDADGLRDFSISFWWGLAWIGLAGVMYASNIGDTMLQVFIGLTGLIPLLMGFAMTPAKP